MEDILNSNEVAQLIGVHLVTVYRYKEQGLLKPFQFRKHGPLKFTLKDIFDLCNGQRTMPELERDLSKIREQSHVCNKK